MFTSPTGTPLRRGNFRRRVWVKATEPLGIADAHFHDLRHTGNNLTAEAGASLRELMERMGHSSTRAALVYLHATSERQRPQRFGAVLACRSASPNIWHGCGTPGAADGKEDQALGC